MAKVSDFTSIRLKIASPEDILGWSHGEVTKPETINYRTQKSEKDGLFCERIFGPEKDYECYCGKYRRVRYKGVICDKCGVEVTRAVVRRERMGHIKLAIPVAHIWFLRGVPSQIGLVLNIPAQQLERVVYYASYIINSINAEAKKEAERSMIEEYKRKVRQLAADQKQLTKKEGSTLSKRGTELDPAKEQKPAAGPTSPFGLRGASSHLNPSQDAGREKRRGLDKPDSSDARRRRLEEMKNRELEALRSITINRVLSEMEYFDLSLKYGECFHAGTGSEALVQIMQGIDLRALRQQLEDAAAKSTGMNQRKILRRLRTVRGFIESKARPEWMFLTVLPVLPPELRPMVQLDGGRYATSDLNDLYRRVINRNNRLKRLQEIKAPEVICRNEKRMLQEAVDALIDNSARKTQTVTATSGGRRLLKSLADMLKGKQGRFRQNLLGKRVDYSGRSVIVVGPDLELHRCGLPKKMALELFRPFVIKQIIARELAYNIRAAGRIIEEAGPEVWEILEEVIKGKYVLLNRAPTLHRLGIQAFQPILIEGAAIQIHPLVCAAFNADFDGDQMAVHVPLSDEAQAEARLLMLSSMNLLKPATGAPIATPTKDIVLGCYWMSKMEEDRGQFSGRTFGSLDGALLAYDMGVIGVKERIKVRTNDAINVAGEKDSAIVSRTKRGEVGVSGKSSTYIETCAGRILFNQTLPDDFPFVNEELNSKALRDITSDIFARYGARQTALILDGIKRLGFLYATISGTSWAMGDLVVPKEKKEILEKARREVEVIRSQFNEGLLSVEERRYKIIEVWQRARQEITKLVPGYLDPSGSVATIANSGARGSWSQINQMTGMKGLAVNPAGQTMELPVEASFKEGLTPLEYFISTHGARKGTADTALRTATAGYLTRRLVDVSQGVVVCENDCGDKDGFEISRKDAERTGQTFGEKIVGRVLVSYGAGEPTGVDGSPLLRGDPDGSPLLRGDPDGSGRLGEADPPSLKISADAKVLTDESEGHSPPSLWGASEGYSAEQTGKAKKLLASASYLPAGRREKVSRQFGAILDIAKANYIEKSGIQSVTVRSPLTCKTIGGICRSCYGWDMGHNTPVKEGEAVGVVAAQAIGEPGTQLTMRTFHTGGVAGASDITQGLPRVEEVFEARSPKGKAAISEVQGIVEAIEDKDKERIVKIMTTQNDNDGGKKKKTNSGGKAKSKEAEVVYRVPKNVGVLVAKGDLVGVGQQLSEGNIDLHDLYGQAGRRATEKYIIESIQKIYTAQGANIHDKHIEIVVRQMFSRARIQKIGDSDFVPGEIVEIAYVVEQNERLKKAGKNPATFEAELLGVTKAALASSSFLAAASFQETSRVLIDTAVMGREDHLVGLKENVIIGKIIPAGTGYRVSR